jgi:serine/threonine protein kinase
MPALFAVRLLRGVVAGLLHLQSSGKSHGDISPENILVTGESKAVLIDCGILGMGAPRFAAPERFRGMPPSAKSDLFSVGAVLYYWLAGEPLFANDKFNSLAEAVSRIEAYDVSLLLHGKGNVSSDILGILKPFWSGLLRLAPENRFEDFEELDEVLEIAELNLSAGEQNKEFQEELWNTTLLSHIETHERMIDARPVEFPFGARCGLSWIRRDFLHWSIASLAVLVLVIVLFFVWMMIIRKTPVDQVGDSMLENTRIIPSEMGISTPIRRDSSTLPEILMGAPTPLQEKEKDHK